MNTPYYLIIINKDKKLEMKMFGSEGDALYSMVVSEEPEDWILTRPDCEYAHGSQREYKYVIKVVRRKRK